MGNDAGRPCFGCDVVARKQEGEVFEQGVVEAVFLGGFPGGETFFAVGVAEEGAAVVGEEEG